MDGDAEKKRKPRGVQLTNIVRRLPRKSSSAPLKKRKCPINWGECPILDTFPSLNSPSQSSHNVLSYLNSHWILFQPICTTNEKEFTNNFNASQKFSAIPEEKRGGSGGGARASRPERSEGSRSEEVPPQANAIGLPMKRCSCLHIWAHICRPQKHWELSKIFRRQLFPWAFSFYGYERRKIEGSERGSKLWKKSRTSEFEDPCGFLNALGSENWEREKCPKLDTRLNLLDTFSFSGEPMSFFWATAG